MFWDEFARSVGGGLGTALAWTIIIWLFWPVWERLINTVIAAIKVM